MRFRFLSLAIVLLMIFSVLSPTISNLINSPKPRFSDDIPKDCGTRAYQGRPFDIPGYDYYGVNASYTTWDWWDSNWNYRISAVQEPVDFDRTDIITWVRMNFSEGLEDMEDPNPFDENSPRVVEYSEAGDILWELPSQVKKERNYDVSNNADCDMVWMLNGTITANEIRYFFIYFDSQANPKSAPAYPLGTTSVTLTDNDSDSDYDEFLLDNTGISVFRKQDKDDEIEVTDTGLDGYYYDKTIGTNLGCGFKFEIEVVDDVSTTTIKEHYDPSLIYKTVEGPLFSEVWVEVLTDPLTYLGHMYEVYRIYEGQNFVELNMWLEELPGYSLSGDWNARKLYHPGIFDRMFGDKVGDWPLQSITSKTQQYLIGYDSGSLDSLGFFMFKRGNLRVSSSNFYDSYFYSAVGFEYNYLWASGDFDSVNNTFRHFQSEVKLGIFEEKTFNIVLPPKGWVFSDDEPVPVSVIGSSSLSDVTATIFKPDDTPIAAPLSSSLGNRRHENLSVCSVSQTDIEGVWYVLVQATSIYGITSKISEFEVRHFKHPTTFINESTLLDLKNKMNTTHKFIWDDIRDYVNDHIDESPLAVLDNGDDVRWYEHRIVYYSIAYLLTGNETYAEEALEWMWQIISYPSWSSWGQGGDLQTSHFIMGVSVGYDWCYDYLTPIERHYIRERVLSETEETVPSYGPRGGTGSTGYYVGNHGQIDNTAIATAAYVFSGERYNGLRFDATYWKSHVAQYYDHVFDRLYPDGSNPEGAAYWSYGLQYLVRYSELVYFSDGTDTFNNPYYQNTSLFRLHFMMPDREQIVNFADAPYFGYSRGRQCLFRLAAANNDSLAQWLGLNVIGGGEDYHSWDLLWYDEKVQPKSPDDLDIPLTMYFPGWGAVVTRSSWDTDAQLFAFKSVRPAVGHEHPDQNGFILYANGEHLAVDLGYTYDKVTENHNTILVDLKGQLDEHDQWLNNPSDPESTAEIVDLFADENNVFIWGDAHKIYPPELNLTRFDRNIAFVNNEYYVIFDDLASLQNRRFDWLLHSYGTFSKQGSVNWIQEGESFLGVELYKPTGAVETVEETWYVPNTKLPPDSGYNSDFEEYQNGHFLRVRTGSDVTETQFMALLFPTLNQSQWPTVVKIDSGGISGLEITHSDDNRKDFILFNPDENSASYSEYGFTARALIVTEDEDGNPRAFSMQNGSSITHLGNTLASATKNVDISIQYKTSYADIEYQTFPLGSDVGTLTLDLYYDGLSMVMLDGIILDPMDYTYDDVSKMLSVQVPSGRHDLVLSRANLEIDTGDIILSTQHVYYGDDLQANVGFDYHGLSNSDVTASLFLNEIDPSYLVTVKNFTLTGSGRLDFTYIINTKGIFGNQTLIVQLERGGSDWITDDDVTSLDFSVRGWDYRIPLSQINRQDVAGLYQPCTVDVNLTSYLQSLGETQRGPVDIDSFRVVEVDSQTGNLAVYDDSQIGYKRYELPMEFVPSSDFDPKQNAKGTMTFVIDGNKNIQQKKYYLYFDTEREYASYPGSSVPYETVEKFQLQFDITGGGDYIPGWVHVMGGSVTFSVHGDDEVGTYTLDLVHSQTAELVTRTFSGGEEVTLEFYGISDGLWDMSLQKSGARDPRLVLGCNMPILFDAGASSASDLLSEPKGGSAVMYFYVPQGVSSFSAYEFHSDEDIGFARFTMKNATGAVMDDNFIPFGLEYTAPYPRTVSVPQGCDGEVWSLTIELEADSNEWDDFRVEFSGISSYFGPSADKVFIPDYIAPVWETAQGYQIEIDSAQMQNEYLFGNTLNISATTDITSNPLIADSVWLDLVDPQGNLVIQDFPMTESAPNIWEANNIYTFSQSDEIGLWSMIVTSKSAEGLLASDAYTITFIGASGNYLLLQKGWNLVSLPLIQSDTNINAVLGSIDGKYDAVQWYNASDLVDPWKDYHTEKPAFLNDLSQIDHKMGIWVHITASGTTVLELNGTAPLVIQKIDLHSGWNLVGFPSTSDKQRDEALNNIQFGIDVDVIWFFDSSSQSWKELNDGDYFKLGKGYWIHSNVEKTWDVPVIVH